MMMDTVRPTPAARTLSETALLKTLLLYPKGLSIAEYRLSFPEPRPSYVAIQNLVRKLQRQDRVKRVGWGRYALTRRYRIRLAPLWTVAMLEGRGHVAG